MNSPIHNGFFRLLFLCTVLFCVAGSTMAQQHQVEFKDERLLAKFSPAGMTQLSDPQDPYQSNIIGRGQVWGRVKLLYQMRPDGDWIEHYDWVDSMRVESPDQIVYTDYKSGMPIQVERIFTKSGKGVDMTIRVETKMQYPLTVGDLSVVLPWSKPAGEDPKRIFEQGFLKHQFLSGDGSYIYFTRANGKGPYLLFSAKPGTRLEYFESEGGQYRVFIHSAVAAAKVEEGTWRLGNTSTRLNGAGQAHSSKEYGFHMEWANSYEELRDILVEQGLIDIRVTPGMTLPAGWDSRFALRTKAVIDSIVPEFKEQTQLRSLPTTLLQQHLYEVQFSRLGENKLTVYYNHGQQQTMEFFVTEALKTLIEKRTAFITQKQQHRDSSKWYNGLYSIWDMKNKVLRGPDNTDGFDFWWGYVLASDDPALCKAPFVAAKNVYAPVDEEIASLEYYVEHFLWGGLQRTDKESYPYGVHGVPNWREARDSSLRLRSRDYNLDKVKVWRAYDYPHIFMLYYHLFQIAEYYPDKVKYVDAQGYLERAYQTAKAYFTYPYEINSWYDTYKWGCYNELVLVPMMADLERYGRKGDAQWLRNEWEKKVKYFVYDDPYPYRSEYSIDRTAFESSYAFAKYGVITPMKPDHKLWYDRNLHKWHSHPQVSPADSRQFMDEQLWAGLAVRGWLTPSYYALGSDDSEGGGLSYMARMGGWSILDYGIHFSEKPWDWLQLGYASYLSSYALINSGTPETNYGYWYPGEENDGASGWAFNTKKYGRIWLKERSIPRGPWNYDGEIDLGNGAIMRMAATLIAHDPLFGWIAYGGNLEEQKHRLRVVPQDGLNIRFGIITGQQRLMLELSRDRFADDRPIITDKSAKQIQMELVNLSGKPHTLDLKLSGTAGSSYQLKVDGNRIASVELDGGKECIVPIQLSEKSVSIELIKN